VIFLPRRKLIEQCLRGLLVEFVIFGEWQIGALITPESTKLIDIKFDMGDHVSNIIPYAKMQSNIVSQWGME